jgi:hypothetical protein
LSGARNACKVILVAAAVILWSGGKAEATVTITGATGGTGVSADTASNAPVPAWTTLGSMTITEGANTDFGTGTSRTLILKAPAGFVFNTAVTPSISFTASRNITSATIAVTDSSTLTITFTVSGTTRADSLVIGSTTGIQIRPTAGTPLAAGNHIFRPTTGGGTAVITGITTSADGSTGSNFGSLNEVAGAATRLAFTTQPTNAVAGAPFGTRPVVTSLDQFGNTSTNGLPATNFVAMSLTGGAGPLQGTAQVDLGLNAGRGIATFSSLRIDAAGSDKQLTVTSTNGLASGVSAVFAVSAGPPGVITIQTQPSSTATAGMIFPQQPVVLVADAFGNPCNTQVTAARASGAGTLQGTVTITAVNGIATYTNLYEPLIGTITISFTSGSATATSASIVVNPGPFTQLQVLLPGETAAPGTASGKTGTPAAQTTGTALGGVIVNAVDAGWNLVNTVNDVVHLTSTDAQAGLPANANLAGGTITFTGVTFRVSGVQALTATDVADATKLGTSSSVTVNVGPFAKIQLLMPGETATPGTSTGKTGVPTAQTASTLFNVRVNGVDANWNVTTAASGSGFTIQLTSTDANATLPASADLASGTQIFNVTLKTAGNATITATDLDNTSLSSTSPSLTVNPGPFARLQLLMPGEVAAPGTSTGKTGTPSAEAAGVAFNVTANAVDTNWNVVGTVIDNVTLSSTDPNATLPSVAALSGGSRTFSVALNTGGSSTVTATDTTDATKTASTSPAIAVNPGRFAQLQLLVPGETAAPGSVLGKTGTPTNQAPGTVFNVIVNAVDARWNMVSTNDTVHLASSDTGAILPADAPFVGGTVTRSVTLSTTATLTATDVTRAGIAGNTSPAINVAKLNQTITFGTLTNQPYGMTPFQVTATASSGLPVTFSIVSGPATVSSNTVAITGVGTVTVRASQAGNLAYNAATNVDQSFTVTAAILVVKADDKSRMVGQTNPPLTATITGFVYGDTSTILTGAPAFSTSANVNSSDGSYPITVSRGTLATTNVNYSFAFTNGVLTVTPLPHGVVAVHDSELNRALQTIIATEPTPDGPGTTGYEWWPTNWQYFVMPESIKEALRSDGTPFATVSDSLIGSGVLLDDNGNPRFPILISLAAEGIDPSEFAPLTNYVAAGGFLLVGSSSFTRWPLGGPRGDFAIANAMGVHSATPVLENWVYSSSFTKVMDHPLVSHIPNGRLNWTWASAADEVPWGTSPTHVLPPSHPVWAVTNTTATVIAWGDSTPYLTVNKFGRGYVIYDAAMQPLIGHGGQNPGMYAYEIVRKAIEWAFATARAPISKLSPWPYNYDSAVVFRHDMEDFTNFINAIEGSAQYENSVGARGDYYFCTGALRDNYSAADRTAEIASLQRAISQYGATIGSHNGGLSNFYNTALTQTSYDYYHWGADEVLNFTPPLGYATAQAYAMASISNSFMDLEGWGLTNVSGRRFYVSPYFNGVRDESLDVLQQLRVVTTGDDKLSPFPSFVRSSKNPAKTYSFVNLPVSDWYVGSMVSQSLEAGHTTNTIHAAVDFYYNLGALINIYSHSSSAGGPGLIGVSGLASQPILEQDYVNYSLSKPRIWSANYEGIYNWWMARSNAQINVTTTNVGDQVSATISITGASDRNTAIEMLLPNSAFTGLQVQTNGVLAAGGYRLNGQVVKVLVGTNVNSAGLQYTLPPLAQPDFYLTLQNSALTVGAPGVLTNDVSGASGGSISAAQVTGPAHGTLLLSTNGGFTYTPATNFYGLDGFTYQITDGVLTSATATVSIQVAQAGLLFSDDFTRPTDPGLLESWTNWTGNWTVTGGVASATSASGYTMAYTGIGSNDYWLEAQVRFSSTGMWGGGLGGRFDLNSGHQYVAWLYPENSPLAPTATLALLKFANSIDFSFTSLQQITLTNGIGTNWHNLKLKCQGSQIRVFYDRSELISLVDNGTFDGQPAYTNGGISLMQFGGPTNSTMLVDNVIVTALDHTPPLVIAADNQTRAYGTTNPPLTGSLVGLQQADNISATFTTAATQASPVGGYPIVSVVSDPDRKLGNYAVNTNNGTLTVTQAVLTVTATSTNKMYGQTLTFAGTEFTATGLVNADSVSTVVLTSAGSAPSAPASLTPYPLVPGGAQGVGVSNYSVLYVNGALTVTQAPLSCTANDTSKPYGTANPAFGGTLVGLLNGDNITATYTTLATPGSSVGAYPITPILSDPNSRLSNYTPTIKNGTLTITAAPLSIIPTGINRVYDGTTLASVQLSDNRLAGDVLTVTYSAAAFADKNVGQNKPVSVSGIAISGPAAGNYTANATANTTANISARALTGSVSINNKPYDGTTAATLGTRTLTGVISGDQVNLTGGIATFNDKNVGTGKPVAISGLSLSGTDASNYTCDSTANSTANITALALAVSAQGINKIYDSTSVATVTLQDNRIPGDVLNASYLGAVFSDKNVGTAKAVTVTGIGISGADAGNYTCNATTATIADITARALTVTAAGANKVYDGTAAATVTLSDNHLSGDIVTESYSTATYGDKNVGASKPVSVSGISLSGADAGNYTCNAAANTTAAISVRAITGTISASNKIYDGATAATISNRLLTGVLSGDSVAYVGGTAVFADKNAGLGKTVTATELTLSGTDAGNYGCNSTAVTTADIAGQPLSVTATANNKIYDGTVNAIVALSDNRLAGDSLTVGYAGAAFADKNAGTAKPVAVNGISLSGPDAGNYIPNTTAGTAADITPFTLTITAQGVNKVYDGTTVATAQLADNRIPGDNLTPGYLAAFFADKRVANDKPVTVAGLTLSGPDAQNYTFNSIATSSASITARPLTITPASSNKMYDGTTNASVTLSDDRLAGDIFTTTYASASFASKYVGVSKVVSVSGIGISGADASNYSVNGTASTAADITPASLTVTAQGVDKSYDGTTAATVTLSDNRLAGDNLTPVYGSATFIDKSVGTGKFVSVLGISLTGPDAVNYTFNTTAFVAATISPRALQVSAQVANKVYDTSTAATVTLSDNRVPGDVLTDTYVTASFADKNVGVAKAVTVTGISISGVDAPNYLANAAAATVADITPATLTVTADAKSKTYGSANPPLTVSITGYLEANVASAVSGQASLTTAATDTSPVGTYAINVLAGTLSAPNYIFNFVPGLLTIMPAPNTAPILANQANRSIVDLTTLTVLNRAVDSDIPANTLTYQLIAPPTGMQISSDGIITWTPTLVQSPSTNVVTTVVTDNGVPPLSATNTFTVIVSGPYDGIDLTDSTQALSDIDGDRLSNLMEYGLGTDPRNPADAHLGLTYSVVSFGGNQYASVQFKRRKLNGGISIQYVTEVSADRVTWYSDSAHVLEVNVSSLDAQFDLVTVRDLTPSSSAAPRFIRLRVIEQ